jgi:hypothetical protein
MAGDNTSANSEANNSTENTNPNTKTNPISNDSSSCTSRLINSSSSAAEHGNSAIMAASLAAGAKLAQSQPTVVEKIGVLMASVAAGGTAIMIKETAKNIVKTKNELIPHIFNSYTNFNLHEIYGLTDNEGLNLLNLILILNNFQISFTILIIYNYVLSKININYINQIMLKYLPTKYVNYIVK